MLLALPACQLVPPSADERPVPSRIWPSGESGIALRVGTDGSANATNEVQQVTPVRRGTLQDVLTFAGQVVPARTAQLTFRTGGTVREVHVRSGDVVRADDPLAELLLDDAALQAALTQATVAELAYQSQAARLEELRRGGSQASVEDARAAVTRARAAMLEAELARDAARGDSALTVEAQLARLAVEQATDELNNAQLAARRSQESESASSTAALRAAERRVEEAALKLESLRNGRNRAEALRQLEYQRAQLELERAQEELARDQLVARRGDEESGAAAEAAAAAVRAAQRQMAAAALRLEATRAPERTAQTDQEGERVVARLELAEAQAELARAQATHRQRQSEQQVRPPGGAVVRIDAAGSDPRTSGTTGSDPRTASAPVPTAVPSTAATDALLDRRAANLSESVADLRAAERRLAEANLRLERLGRAREAERGGAPERELDRQLAQLQLDTAMEELSRAQIAEQATARRSEEESRTSASAAALTVRAAERRVQDAQLRIQQVELAAQAASDADIRLAELALAQAQDDLAATRTQQQLAAQREQEAAQASASTTAFAVRAAERKLAEATLRLQSARASEQSQQASRASQGEIPDLRVTAAREALQAAEARLRELETSVLGGQTLQNEERRVALLQSEAMAARAAAQPVVVLKAPFDGTVTAVEVTPNQNIEARTTVVRLDDPGRLSVQTAVSEWEVGRLSADQPVQVDFAGGLNETTEGRIADVSAAAVRQGDRVMFPVRVDIGRMPPSVRVGMTATVSMHVQGNENTLYVPATAVRTMGGATTVLRVRPDGSTEEVPVVVGRTIGNNVEILSGLSDQEAVASRGPRFEPRQMATSPEREQPPSGSTSAPPGSTSARGQTSRTLSGQP